MVLQKGVWPVIGVAKRPWLSRYPDQGAARLLRDGFEFGFIIPCAVPPEGHSLKNLKSAREQPEVIRGKLEKEVALGRMAGPFSVPPLERLVVSPLGVVPKKERGKFRLIHHLSFPKGASVNDGIDKELSSVSYTSFDFALGLVREAGPGARMAKTDIESAFRLLPVHPDSLYLLGCFFEGGYYVDRCLPMGCSISCAYFEAFSSFLEWVVKERAGVGSVTHYLDDFLCVGPADTGICELLLGTMLEVFGAFGVPVAHDKTEGPATVIQFLGIEIDTVGRVCRLPREKIEDLVEGLEGALAVRKVTLQQLQSILGKLNFACRVLPMGRVFTRRLSLATVGVREPHHFIRLTAALKEDIRMWITFLESFDGRAYWLEPMIASDELELFTDAAGSGGFGAYLAGRWCAGSWPGRWPDSALIRNLAFLELFPLVVAVTLWGEVLRNRAVCFRSDNMSVVAAVNTQTSSSMPVVVLLRQLLLGCLR
ncbi:uncharacterized protein PAF06_000477 [Gastrophryne carolinensis]